ncbi:MAG: hypothetical protein ACOYK1_04695 [Vampirovibrionia bacterium]
MGELVDRYRRITDMNRQRQLAAVYTSDLEEMTKANISQAISDTLFKEYKSSEYTYWKNLMGGDANAIYNRIMAGAA